MKTIFIGTIHHANTHRINNGVQHDLIVNDPIYLMGYDEPLHFLIPTETFSTLPNHKALITTIRRIKAREPETIITYL